MNEYRADVWEDAANRVREVEWMAEEDKVFEPWGEQMSESRKVALEAGETSAWDAAIPGTGGYTWGNLATDITGVGNA